MYKILIFAGTREGRELAEYCNRNAVPAFVCVATEYGEQLLPEGENLSVSHERLTGSEMEELMIRLGRPTVIDATHPYAAVVTENIQTACRRTDTPYLRLVRRETELSDRDVIWKDSLREAVDYLETQEGKILAVTGSKELAEYTRLTDYRERVFARVLSLASVASSCRELGFEGKNLICMQGPFSRELNAAMIRQLGTRFLVTKESGTTGGFLEKYEAAKETGSVLVVIGRPKKEKGLTLEECKKRIAETFGLPEEAAYSCSQQIALVGIGMGERNGMTLEAQQAVREADLVIGAGRMVEAAAGEGQLTACAYEPEKIRDLIRKHPWCSRIAVVLSGDVGFYSGARKLLDVLPAGVRVICGISSPVYFCSRLQMAWEDVVMASVHGREQNVLGKIRSNRKVFALVGNEDGVSRLCEKLTESGLSEATVYVGQRLSYPEEEILSGKPADFVGRKTDKLAVVLVENPEAERCPVTHGIPDESFLRDKVPMTKEEVRSVSLSRLRLTKAAVVYDVGAGTGSVSIEAALQAEDGLVYAIEKKPEAVELLRRNKEKFGAENVRIVEGLAPEALRELPPPTHVFVGGSSGNLREILQMVLDKNPDVRVVINAIALETVAEAVSCFRELDFRDVEISQICASRAKKLGAYQMMMGQNPVYILSGEGRGV